MSDIIKEISEELDGLPLGLSRYEFENFLLESQPTMARQLAAVMAEIESLHAKLTSLDEPLSFGENGSQKIAIRRERSSNQKRYDMLVEWISRFSKDDRRKILSSYDKEEGDYWANYLGRQAALEILTTGKASKDTMDKMSSLPVADFEEAVRICVRYAKLITDTTAMVEGSMGIRVENVPAN